ncbi:sel1 repeat protein [Gigaspora margarita]|nr:sel1 repeat protein [Gigaspora margarita]
MQQLRTDLKQTRELITALESRLKLTEQTSQLVLGELKQLTEQESESCITAVEEINQDDYNDSDIFKLIPDVKIFSSDDNVEIYDYEIDDYNDKLSDLIHKSDDSTDSFDRICTSLQTLINDAQIALQKKPSNDNFHLSHSPQCLGLPSTRSRSSSRSSNVSNWLMNHYSPANSAWECGCGYCVLCLASDNISIIESRPNSTRTTPRTSRRNSVTSRQKCLNPGNPTIPDIPEENFVNRKQRQLSVIKRLYRYQLEHKSDYKRSCENLELELQKFVSTALMDSSSSSCDDYESIDEFTCYKCRNDSNHSLFVETPKKDGMLWRKRLWNYLKEKVLASPLISSDKDTTTSYNNIEEIHDDYYDDFTNNNWSNYYKDDDYSNSSSAYSHDPRIDDDSTPFPSSFGQNIFCNVNIVNNTTKTNNNRTSYSNNIYNNDNSNNTFNTKNNYYHDTVTTNNYYYSSSSDKDNNKENMISKNVHSISNFPSITKKRFMNLFAIIGILIGILQNGFISSKGNGNLYYKRKLMGGPLLLTIISRALYAKRNNGVRSKKDVIAMIKVIKYVTVLFVGWSVGRMGS